MFIAGCRLKTGEQLLSFQKVQGDLFSQLVIAFETVLKWYIVASAQEFVG